MSANTPRERMTQKRRQHIFTEHCTAHNVAPCCVCGNPVHRYDDEWQVEHLRALALLGKDTNTNCAPAHTACAREKTHKQDLPAIRKAKRVQQKHFGERKPGRLKIPEGFKYDWKTNRLVRLHFAAI